MTGEEKRALEYGASDVMSPIPVYTPAVVSPGPAAGYGHHHAEQAYVPLSQVRPSAQESLYTVVAPSQGTRLESLEDVAIPPVYGFFFFAFLWG